MFRSGALHTQPNSKQFDRNLEVLRGYAALFVVLGHLIGYKYYLDPNFFPEKLILFLTPSHFSVLIFFVLSGYVIGISNKQRIVAKSILVYLKKRFIRLYPIYILVMLFTIGIVGNTYNIGTIFSNLTFTQIVFAEVIWENNPIWSLHYEVLYYIAFIAVSFFKINLVTVTLFSIAVGIGNFLLYPFLQTPIVTAYFIGFAFWLSGLVLAKYFNNVNPQNKNIPISNIFLGLSFIKFNVLVFFLKEILFYIFRTQADFPESVSWYEKAIGIYDLAFLPYCILFILNFTGKDYRCRKCINTIFQILPVITVYLIALKIRSNEYVSDYWIPMGWYTISLVLFFCTKNYFKSIINGIFLIGAWLGEISYGIYIVHFPILILFRKASFFSGNRVTFVVRFLVFILLILVLSYALEKRFQPWIKRKLTS